MMAIEHIGHLTLAVSFLVVAIYATLRRPIIRRTTRRSTALYWLIVIGSIFIVLVNVIWMVNMWMQDANPPLWLDALSEYLGPFVQGIVILLLIGFKVVLDVQGGRKTRILVIGAHPDDVEIACGATIARLSDAGHTIQGMVMTRGEMGGNAQVRPDEARSGARFLGLDRVRVLDFPDTRLHEHVVELIGAIESVIQEFKPEIIFTHSLHDRHQDHRAVHEATLRAARTIGTILCYEGPSATPEFQPTFFVDIGDYIDVKIESIKEHWDQHTKPYVQPERVRGTAIFRGGQAGCRYAEGFEIVRMLSSSIGGLG